jgi:hypothetical protein
MTISSRLVERLPRGISIVGPISALHKTLGRLGTQEVSVDVSAAIHSR